MFRKIYNSYGITSIISLSGFLLGLEYSSMTAFLSSHQFIEYFGILSTWEQIMISSGNSIGAVCGCVVCGAILDWIGSILALQLACLPWVCGTVVAIFLANIYMVVGARVLKGISMGFISTILPVYVSETLPNRRRGSALAIVQLSSTLGTLGIYHVGNLFQTHILTDFSFRYAWMVESFPMILLLVLSFFLPESPRWYGSRSKWQEAAKTLDRLKKEDKSLDQGKRVLLGDRGYVMTSYTSEPNTESHSYSDLFGKKYWKYTMVGVTIQSLVQITGVTTIMYFFVYVCEACGLHGEGKVWILSSQFLIYCIFTVFPVLLLDASRRKDSLIFGFLLLSATFGSIWIIILLNKYDLSDQTIISNSPFDWQLRKEPASAVIALFLFLVAVYSSTLLCGSWLYTGEIFPVLIRSKGTSICMGVSWALNLCLSILVPMALPHLKYWIFGIFSIICFMASLTTMKFPETRGLQYSELESLFKDFKSLEIAKENNNSAEILGEVDDNIGREYQTEAQSLEREVYNREMDITTADLIIEADKNIISTLKNRNLSIIHPTNNDSKSLESLEEKEIPTKSNHKKEEKQTPAKVENILSTVGDTSSEDEGASLQLYTPMLAHDSSDLNYSNEKEDPRNDRNDKQVHKEKLPNSALSMGFSASSEGEVNPNVYDQDSGSYVPFAMLEGGGSIASSPNFKMGQSGDQLFSQYKTNARFGSNMNAMITFSHPKQNDNIHSFQSEERGKRWKFNSKNSS